MNTKTGKHKEVYKPKFIHARYLLDPDYRVEPDTSKPFCIRCQKPIKNVAKAVPVTEHNKSGEWATFVSVGGKSLIGADCWLIIKKQAEEWA